MVANEHGATISADFAQFCGPFMRIPDIPEISRVPLGRKYLTLAEAVFSGDLLFVICLERLICL